VAIDIPGIVEGGFSFAPAEAGAADICGIPGRISCDVANGERCKVRREFFSSDDKRTAGIRVIIENISSGSFELSRIMPVSARGHDGLRAAGTTFSDWHVLRMARNKNDVPGCFRPAAPDGDFEDAAFDSAEIPAGMGVSEEDSKTYTRRGRSIVSDPCVFLKNYEDMSIPGLFVSVLGQHEHLTQIVMEGDEERGTLASFEVVCEFDHVRVDPRERRSTHWILFREERNHRKALDQFSAMLANMYQCPKPPFTAPSVYCSWYFYGPDFRERDLDEALRTLAESPTPFDVFLLDDGWSDSFGSWQAGERFPGGMRRVAEKIKAAGYRPGIWTCPFVVMADSPVAEEHPELLARDLHGNPYPFPYQGPECYAVDPTSPYAFTYFKRLYERLKDWGFEAHKFDFLRSILTTDKIRFHNRKYNRAQAYRQGMSLLRKAIGKDSYILACGGLFEGSIGMVDGMRTGSDTRGFWRQPGYSKSIKQNVVRNYTNRFWHTDPDAAMLWLRSEPFRGVRGPLGSLSLGKLTDEEAFTIVVNQYIGGGMTCFSARFAELQPERKALLRHIIPAEFPVADVLDMFHAGCPTLFLSRVKPRCKALGKWWTLAIGNWEEEEVRREIALSDLGLPGKGIYALFEFKEQRFLGIMTGSDSFGVIMPPHGMRLIRIAPMEKNRPIILGTDMHLTGGGVELADVVLQDKRITGRVDTQWRYPVRVTAGFSDGAGLTLRTLVVGADEPFFEIAGDAAVCPQSPGGRVAE